MTLRARWLGTVTYNEALRLQRGLFHFATEPYLLLCEHRHVYTLGRRGNPEHMLVDPAAVGAELVSADRGGDITYHGPGQLVGYPILQLADHSNGEMANVAEYVHSLESLLIDTLTALGLAGAARIDGCSGVWMGAGTDSPRKIAAIGVKVSRGRTMHGFALNVDPDMAMFANIVACGIADKGVTSCAAEGLNVTMQEVVQELLVQSAGRWASDSVDFCHAVWRIPHNDVDLSPFSRGEGPGEAIRFSANAPEKAPSGTSVRLTGRLAEAGVTMGLAITERKPEWMRAQVRLDADVLRLRKSLRSAELVTVCEEAGCPNLSECWSSGTATFMLCGDRCTRACGFCLVDTQCPLPLDTDEPGRVAAAAARGGLSYVVLTMVARDDLADGGASQVAATIAACRAAVAGVRVEALVSDFKGDEASIQTVIDARPDVFNHNIETVLRLQRAIRPSASYARSLAVLSQAKEHGCTTKSGFVAGMGESDAEVRQTLIDLANIGVDIVTIGQYLRPTSNHVPVERWWTPEQFHSWKEFGERELGISHVESSPLTRSSYHAQSAADSSAMVMQ